jgi:hypothetical protein
VTDYQWDGGISAVIVRIPACGKGSRTLVCE